MRLRRETGDFQIKVTVRWDDSKHDMVSTWTPARKGLSKEDLLGEIVIVNYDDSEYPGREFEEYGVLTRAYDEPWKEDNDLIAFSISSMKWPQTAYYNPITGEISNNKPA